MPQIQVWINKDDSNNVAKLVKQLNGAMLANKDKKLKAFFIFLGDEKLSPALTAIAEKANANDVCLAYLSPKDEAIKAYKVNLDPAVKNTVMLYKRRTVTSKIVNLVADEKGSAQLDSAIADLLK